MDKTSKKQRKAWRIALKNSKALCPTHGTVQRVVGYEKPQILVLECGCKRHT